MFGQQILLMEPPKQRGEIGKSQSKLLAGRLDRASQPARSSSACFQAEYFEEYLYITSEFVFLAALAALYLTLVSD